MLNNLNEKLAYSKRNNVFLVRKRRTIRAKKPLMEGYVMTPHGQVVQLNEVMKRQFQRGGFEIMSDGIVRKRQRSSNNTERPIKKVKFNDSYKRIRESRFKPRKRQRLLEDIDHYSSELFELVNVEYVVTYRTEYEAENRFHRVKGFMRNVIKISLQFDIDQMTSEYCLRNNLYPTFVESQLIKTTPVPERPTDLIHERMMGVSLNYHYLPVDPNSSSSRECVYNYILLKYGSYLKTLTKEVLMELFQESDPKAGVSTHQILRFCRRYNIVTYSLDLEFSLFNHYRPEKPSHKLPALVYVCANQHLYPVVEEAVRASIFASERQKSSNSSKYYKKIDKVNFNENEVVLNPCFKDLSNLENKNVVYGGVESLEALVIYLYQTEQTIYASESYDSVIRKINYKNGVFIYLNSDYQDVLESCSLLIIPFKNQSKVQLINEAFQIYTRGDKIYSTLNSESRKVFFDFHKGPFVFSRYYPDEDANLTAVDLNPPPDDTPE